MLCENPWNKPLVNLLCRIQLLSYGEIATKAPAFAWTGTYVYRTAEHLPSAVKIYPTILERTHALNFRARCC